MPILVFRVPAIDLARILVESSESDLLLEKTSQKQALNLQNLCLPVQIREIRDVLASREFRAEFSLENRFDHWVPRLTNSWRVQVELGRGL